MEPMEQKRTWTPREREDYKQHMQNFAKQLSRDAELMLQRMAVLKSYWTWGEKERIEHAAFMSLQQSEEISANCCDEPRFAAEDLYQRAAELARRERELEERNARANERSFLAIERRNEQDEREEELKRRKVKQDEEKCELEMQAERFGVNGRRLMGDLRTLEQITATVGTMRQLHQTRMPQQWERNVRTPETEKKREEEVKAANAAWGTTYKKPNTSTHFSGKRNS